MILDLLVALLFNPRHLSLIKRFAEYFTILFGYSLDNSFSSLSNKYLNFRIVEQKIAYTFTSIDYKLRIVSQINFVYRKIFD